MRVDERGREHQALALDHSMAVHVDVGPELRDHAFVHANVADAIEPLRRVDDTGAAHDQVLQAPPFLHEEHHATSSGSVTSTGTGPVVSRS